MDDPELHVDRIECYFLAIQTFPLPVSRHPIKPRAEGFVWLSDLRLLGLVDSRPTLEPEDKDELWAAEQIREALIRGCRAAYGYPTD
jgi:hypothetical protein